MCFTLTSPFTNRCAVPSVPCYERLSLSIDVEFQTICRSVSSSATKAKARSQRPSLQALGSGRIGMGGTKTGNMRKKRGKYMRNSEHSWRMTIKVLCLSVSICVYLCLSVSICVYLCLSVSICVYPCLSVSICVYLCLSVSICVYLCLSVSEYQCL